MSVNYLYAISYIKQLLISRWIKKLMEEKIKLLAERTCFQRNNSAQFLSTLPWWFFLTLHLVIWAKWLIGELREARLMPSSTQLPAFMDPAVPYLPTCCRGRKCIRALWLYVYLFSQDLIFYLLQKLGVGSSSCFLQNIWTCLSKVQIPIVSIRGDFFVSLPCRTFFSLYLMIQDDQSQYLHLPELQRFSTAKNKCPKPL